MKDKPDYRYVKGLQNRDSVIIREIYDVFFPENKKWLLGNSGSEEDARDIFQDTLFAIYQNVHRDFELYGSFGGYLKKIFRNKWFKQLDKRKRSPRQTDDIQVLENHSAEDDLADNSSKLINFLYKKHINLLKNDCQKIIQLKLFDNLPHKQIAEQLNYTFDTARQKYARCFRKLLDFIKNDPLTSDLLD